MNAPKILLVTGATGHLGRAIVAALRAQHHTVVANFWRDQERAQTLAAQTGCALWRADVREQSAVQNLFESHDFDAVIHAAATNRDALLLRTSAALWREQMRWAQAAFLVTRASLQFLPANGQLLLIASRVGERGGIGQSAYATHKGALIGLMRAAAAERRDLKINAICPGFAVSALAQNLSETQRQARAAHDILPNADARQSLAALCVFLMNSSLSGQVLRPDCRI